MNVNQFTPLLQHAAELLAGVRHPPDVAKEVLRLIAMLGYGDGDLARNPQRAALLAAAAKLKRLFQLSAPEAPGLVFFGGEADPCLVGWRGSGHPPISLAGGALSLAQAFESCVSEGVEYLSQFETEADVIRHETFDNVGLGGELGTFVANVLDHVRIKTDQPIAWVEGKRLRDGTGAWLPADICLRRSGEVRDFVAPFKLSTGCGAGASLEDAVLHGLCELIERDAVSLWWRGGLRGGVIDSNSGAGRAAAELLATLRAGATRRSSWVMDISTDLGVPCVAAISVGAAGREFACGHAARPTRAAAIRSAILEMCQMELGQAVIAAKLREGGEGALNAADRTHLRRANLIDARCLLLHPVRSLPAEEGGALTLAAMVARLGSMGIEPLAVELTRPQFGIPVVRVVTPQLQLEPSAIVTKRLSGIIERTGGAEAFTAGIALM